MTKLRSRAYLCVISVLFFAVGGATVHAADACKTIKDATERSKLQKQLSSNDFSQSEQVFLLKGVDQRRRELKQRGLNERGTRCGIEAVRALILGCMNAGLPSTLRSVPTPTRKTGTAMWGKENVSALEAAVVGVFHACRGAVMETFLSE